MNPLQILTNILTSTGLKVTGIVISIIALIFLIILVIDMIQRIQLNNQNIKLNNHELSKI